MTIIPAEPAVAAGALERLTIRRYLLAMFAQGVWYAGYLLFPFVLGKSLNGSAELITVTAVMETAAMVLALYWGQLMIRGGRRRWLVWGGLGGRVIMVAVIWVHGPLQFAVVLAAAYFFAGIIYPAQNGILQANIRAGRRGGIFGWGALIQNGTAALVSILLGRILDTDPDRFRLVYPVIGVVGFLYPLALARLPRPAGDTSHDPTSVFTVPRLPLGQVRLRRLAGALVTPFREAAATFRQDRPFFWFEFNFTVYGMAFMMLVPVVPLYFVQELQLDYEQISTSRVLIAAGGVALLGPLAGRLMDRLHPVRMATMSYLLVAAFPLALSFAESWGEANLITAIYLAFGVYSVAMAGVNVVWNMGSLAFAPPGQGGYYQGIHVAMVGIRGMLGPALGYVVLQAFGYREVFWLATGFFGAAGLSSALLARRMGLGKSST